MSISKSLYKGAVWNAVSQFGTQGINFVTIIILARLLGPKDFGLVGMVSVITSFLGYFTEFGLLASLIQKKDIDRDDCDTVYWSTVAFSLVLYAAVFFIGAPAISAFYHEERLVLLTRVLFLNFLVAPLCFIPEALEVKKLKYDKITAANLVAALFSGIVGIALALMNFGVWSLVWQQISSTLFRGVVFTVTIHWWPRLYFSYAKFKQLFNFGLHFTFRNVVNYLSENIDYLLVGRLLGPSALGIYTLAFRISKYAFLKLWGIFGKMLFPAFSAFKEDLPRVRKNYMKVATVGGLILAPVFIGVFFGLDSLVPVLIGEKWIETVPVVRIFIIYLLFASVSYADDSLMIALGKIKVLNVVKTLAAAGLLLSGYILTKKYGIVGMAAAFTGISLAYILIVQKMLFRQAGISYRIYLGNMRMLLFLSVGMAALLGTYAWALAGRVPNLVFLAGEGALMTAALLVFIRQTGLVDLKARKINWDKIVRT